MKRTMTDKIKAAVTGIPTVEEADAALDIAAEALNETAAVVEAAQADLDAAHLTGEADRVLRAEAALSGSDVNRDRTQRRHEAAQRHHGRAVEAEVESKRKAARKDLEDACQSRLAAAAAVDAAAEQMGEAFGKLVESDQKIALAAREGVINDSAIAGFQYGHQRSAQLIRLATTKAKLPGTQYVGDRSLIPSTVNAVAVDVELMQSGSE